jgi:hypothetical protein
MFRRKRIERDEPDSDEGRETRLELEVLPATSPEHLAKLQTEERRCPTCTFRIINPMTDRCPRCFSSVPPSDHTNCGECDYQGNCELAQIKKRIPKR